MKTSYAKLLGVALLLLPAAALNAQQSGTVLTIGGAFAGFVDGDNSVSQFNTPTGLALDGAGNLYIADSGNNAVRVMQLNSTQVRTLATVSNPSGLALDRGTNLYVTSLSLGNVTKFDAFGNVRGVILAGLSQPTALASDTNDNLYVTELTGRVRRFATNGTVTGTYQVTTGSPQLRGVAVLPGGRVIVSDAGNHVLWQFSGPGAAPTVYAGTLGSRGFTDGAWSISKMNGPHQIAAGPFGSIVFADRFNHRVRVVNCDRTVRTLFGIDPSQWETFPDPSIFPGWFDGTTEFAESRDPVGVAVNPQGVVYDTEVFYHLIREASGFSFIDCGGGGGGGTGTNNVPVPVIFPDQGFFLNGVNLIVTASNISKAFGPDVRLYYTLDGSTPNPSSPSIPIVDGQGEIFLQGPVDLGDLKVIAIDAQGSSSPVVSGRPSGGVNYMTLGFDSGPASSDFVATPGQRFVAPVTLSIAPGTTMHGLQFSLKVDAEGTSPNVDGNTLEFESGLAKPSLKEPGIYELIPPMMFTSNGTPGLELTTVNTGAGDRFVITVPVEFENFSSMIFRNPGDRLLGVGWLELPPKTNLYNTAAQDLIRYSFAHNIFFTSDKGKVVPGAFSFQVPPNAENGDSYIVQVARPSATGGGNNSDPVILSPQDYFDNFSAVRRLTIGIKEYIVGDVMPFRWYNAGDFGDGSILNNDISQMQAAIIYRLGVPASGSDFEDAYDSCCIGTDGFDYSSGLNTVPNTVETINKIAFGDGRLTIADMFVSYWRSLDTNFVWYARYWSNGVLNAKIVPNRFRGGTGFSTLSTRQFASSEADQPNSDPLLVKLEVLGAIATPGQVLDLPVRVKVSGGVPIRSMLFQAKVETLDGGVPVALPVQFFPSAQLGPPSFANVDTPGIFGGAWMELARTSVNGETDLGTLRVSLPANASSASAWSVKLEDVSASPNGIYLFPVEANAGTIFMKNRPVNWGDEIPNAWREQYFTSAISYDARLDGDPDGDGANNQAEYRAGTNPMDRSDALKLRAATASANAVNLSWRSVAGKKYQIEASSDLINGPWEPVGTPKDGSGSELQSTDDSGGGPKFYRVRIVE